MPDTIALDSFDTKDRVLDELYTLVRDGLTDQLLSQLTNLSNRTEYLTSVNWYGQEQLSLLMVAALHGHEDIVRILFEHCKPEYQVELEGTIILDNQTILEGITALYCACYRAKFAVARLLIETGRANANHSTLDEPYHPLLIHATRMNRLDIVQFLIENNYADVNKSKSTTRAESTALVWAVRRNNISIVKYLIEKGAHVDYYCKKSYKSKFATPLTLAVHDGNLELVQILFNAGADTNVKNKSDDTLLAIAVKLEHWPIIQFLLEQSVTNIDEVERAVLFLIERRPLPIDMNKLYKYLYFILQQRVVLQKSKVCRQPLAVYDYHQECQTLEELESIKNDSNRIWIEVLLVLERILLPRKDPILTKALNGYSHYLLAKNDFDKCLALWIHSFYISKQMQRTMTLYPFVRLFCKMITTETMIPIDRFIEVCQFTFDSTRTTRDQITYNQVCFVVITAKIFEHQQITSVEKIVLCKWISQLCRQWQMPSDRQTIVHLCISGSNYGYSYRNSSHTEPYLRFPNESALQLVLACGRPWLDLDAVESSMHNTALHLLCHVSENQTMIKSLLNAGAHIDCVNRYGFTPLMYATGQETKAFLKSRASSACLKCLCARMIVNQRLNTSSIGPATSKLNKFISRHGSLVIESEHK
ncbi:unnamed protein product [Rotaria magnacalcarata]|uniref:Uncharacterized protein n=2 Tax=Rotaria magnacalcarata TaxID=392030 RepID=A0A814YPS7_9BILA|nr:unnamed protein product [Rotaria magnacalcarata]CAF1430027.1 unnamed protein product [Rotaria magnacalcarata]CAF2239598.1 unnamed protein product [Rotaria magnacalcarata]CAF4356062.1 unnamed protein product [Rotaria magnacalcarata]